MYRWHSRDKKPNRLTGVYLSPNDHNMTQPWSEMLWVGPLVSPESHVALNPATGIDMNDKLLFIQLCYFLCWNSVCEKSTGMGIHVKIPLQEKE